MDTTGQTNTEYFFRLIYDCIHGACYGGLGSAGLSAWLAHLWVIITFLSYVLTIAAIAMIVYATMRLFALREAEEHQLGTLELAPEASEENPRWLHIQSLMESGSTSDYRQAIIEADIMLDDMLARQGYQGASVGDKLKQITPERMGTLQEAWSAHQVRNDIAHQGSTFDLSATLARRTLSQYEAVFREFGAI